MKKKTPPTLTPRPPYTVKLAAEYLGVSDDTVRRLIEKRVLRASRIIRKILIPGIDVENLVESTGY